MGKSTGKYKNGEYAVRDKANVPVSLLYDETNDKTKMARSTSEGYTLSAVTDLGWKQYRYDWDTDNNLKYKGMHLVQNEASSSSDYWIIKYTYETNNLVRKQYLQGSWDNRATLDW